MKANNVFELSVFFKGTKSSSAMKEHALEKFSKLTKYIHHQISGTLVVCIEKKDCWASIHVNAGSFEASAESREHDHNLYKVIDDVLAKVEQQAKKFKEKEQVKGIPLRKLAS